MSKPILYSQEISPPCRAVLLTGEAIGVKFDIREIDLLARDHFQEDFLKINPRHTIPTLVDDGYVIWDSHAIMAYLVDKYAADDSLYPKDLQKRATVNQYLHFETGTIFQILRDITKPIIFDTCTEVSSENMETLEKALDFLNKFLDGKQWLVGDSYTIADISCVSSVSCLTVYKSLDDYPNVKAWLKRCEEQLPGYETLNAPGNKQIQEMIKQKLADTS